MKGIVLEQPPTVERDDDGEKDKDRKKKRRSRRSKQNPSVSEAACGLVDETLVEASVVEISQKQTPKTFNVASSSLPTMHIAQNGKIKNEPVVPYDLAGNNVSKSCPETIIPEEPSSFGSNKESHIPHQGYRHRNYFSPHWSKKAVEEAVVKGNVYKALFRVNVHNRLEAYCSIDGAPVDVLISGITSQNRAVEGDTVAIKIDPLSLWTKIKGSSGVSTSITPLEDCNSVSEICEFGSDNCKDKNKIEADNGYANLVPPKNPSYDSNNGNFSNVYQNIESQSLPVSDCGWNSVSGYNALASNSSIHHNQDGAICGKEKLCSMISLFPNKRPTGRVVAIIEMSSSRDTVVGSLSVKQLVSAKENYKRDGKKKKFAHEFIMLTPTDQKFPKMTVLVRDLPECIKRRLDEGDLTVDMELVGACVTDWGEDVYLPQAYITHVFGKGGDIEAQIAAISFENSIRTSEFSPECLSCIPQVPWKIPDDEIQRRKDLRELCIFTIDPSSATDLDDALSVQMLSDGNFRVSVHIADVSYFVLPDTALDIEALHRSTSFYFLHGKIPMLPQFLSDDLGSLNPGVDRLCFSIFWDISLSGDILNRWIGRSVIKSCCKLSYDHAQNMIEGHLDDCCFPELHGQFKQSDIVESVQRLHKISKILRDKRFNDGALHLDCSKLTFLLNDNGDPYDSVFYQRTESNCLVEEFMLLANRTVAEIISKAYPHCALLRRHPEPNFRKLQEFEAFCAKHGLALDISSSRNLRCSLEQIREKLKNDSVLFHILLSYASKPMQSAKYFCTGDLDIDIDWGHYSLAVPFYTHFTSPLRRYPDIIVHRTLSATLEAGEIYESNKNCFTGLYFDTNAAESAEGREALSVAALKYRIPSVEVLADVAAYCNERKYASRMAKDSTEKVYMWALLKKKEILLTKARVLALGPKFMSIYIPKLSIERRIYYDEVDDIASEWLDSTSTLVLSLLANKRVNRRTSSGKCKTLDDFALIKCPFELKLALEDEELDDLAVDVEPAVFPLTVSLLSTITIAVHAVGGDDGPLDIKARLYMSSYLR